MTASNCLIRLIFSDVKYWGWLVKLFYTFDFAGYADCRVGVEVIP